MSARPPPSGPWAAPQGVTVVATGIRGRALSAGVRARGKRANQRAGRLRVLTSRGYGREVRRAEERDWERMRRKRRSEPKSRLTGRHRRPRSEERRVGK